MAASDHLSKQLFHGSIHPFKVGDVIKPQNHKEAFATSSPWVAGLHAAAGNYRALKTDVEKARVKAQPVLFGTIYKVEPVNKSDVKTEKWWDTESDTPTNVDVHTSASGFKVTGVHSIHPQNDENEDFRYPTMANKEHQKKTGADK